MEFLLGHIVADREHPAVWIYEKGEMSFFSEFLRLKCSGVKPRCEGTQILSGFRKRGPELLAEAKQGRVSGECARGFCQARFKRLGKSGCAVDGKSVSLPKKIKYRQFAKRLVFRQ